MTETQERVTVGDRISQRLKEMDRGPTWLGKRIGRHSTTIWGWTKGRHVPSLGMLGQIADALGVSQAWLLGEDVLDA